MCLEYGGNRISRAFSQKYSRRGITPLSNKQDMATFLKLWLAVHVLVRRLLKALLDNNTMSILTKMQSDETTNC